MIQVKEEKISNEKLRAKFYNIPDVHRLIVMKQLNFQIHDGPTADQAKSK